MDAPQFGGEVNQEPVGEAPVGSPDSGNPFLNEVEASHRQVVAPYLKKWDAEATKKFQEYSEKLKPYETLGAAEDLMKMKTFTDNFRRDPEGIFRLMFQNLHQQYGDDFESKLLEILQLQAEEEMNATEGYEGGFEGQPDPNEVFQQNVSSELEELKQWRAQQEASFQEQEQESQLASFMETMHNQFGEFDDDWVLLRLGEHGDPNKAIQQWKTFLGKVGSSPRQPPKVMGGQGGGVPNQQIDTNKLRGADRRKYIDALLGQQGD